MLEIGAIAITMLSLIIWIFLLTFWGNFWRCDQRLAPSEPPTSDGQPWPDVTVLIPARDEADVLPQSLPSLLQQDYAGSVQILLTDDQSRDGTGHVAQAIATELQATERLQVIPGQPLPVGWSGKLWAIEQGWQRVQQQTTLPDYLLLTDADIIHSPQILAQLVHKAETEQLALVSLMVRLRCDSSWEKLLIPPPLSSFSKTLSLSVGQQSPS